MELRYKIDKVKSAKQIQGLQFYYNYNCSTKLFLKVSKLGMKARLFFSALISGF